MTKPKFKVFARHDASMRNGSFVKVYMAKRGPDKGRISHFINGDYMGPIAQVPADHIKEYSIKDAKAMSPVGI